MPLNYFHLIRLVIYAVGIQSSFSQNQPAMLTHIVIIHTLHCSYIPQFQNRVLDGYGAFSSALWWEL